MSFPIILTNMCMIYDPDANRVVIQRRKKSRGWSGITFPGGHVEPGESFADSAAREVLEETGLTVTGLHCCGNIHWDNLDPDNQEQYIVYLYRTSCFSGELLKDAEEGDVEWMDLDKLQTLDPKLLSPHFSSYLELFLSEGWKELHAPWTAAESDEDAEKHYRIYQ
ncbi:MAG: 8-oxo-dGTP diphosphatase [Oscillospiraceae bacterium]|jgi:8-oxo-dGTP diphosphatase|nr:8-oxo-dGTP diphosphatase [Oscillospiraceae bacterium]